MFHAILSLISALLVSSAVAADRGPAIPDYPAEQVAKGLYVIHGPVGYPSPENQGFMNNPAFIVSDQGVVVVDPGSSMQAGEMVLRQIRKVTDAPVLAVINTHVHGDHWLGNHALRNAFPEVPIYAHPKMIQAVQEGAGEEWVGRMLKATNGATLGTRVHGPNIAVHDGDEVRLGGLTYRFHHFGHVHTQTDLMIEVVERKALFLGDNANNRRIVRMDDGSFRGSIAALEEARKSIPAEILIPGHGRTGGWEILDSYRDYMAELYKVVAELYDEGMSDFEMKPKVAARLARYKDWPGFEEELGKHISLAYLEAEAAAF
jgi:glyoxylase-like metal-dependent hydrolase (beta-lactamase superfamily II)